MMEQIRALRGDRDLKQKNLAELSKVSRPTYSDYERGKANIPAAALKKPAIFYGTSINCILALADDPRPYPRKRRISCAPS